MVSTIVHLPRMLPPMDFFFKRIGLVSMDLLYIIFTCYTQVNQWGQLILPVVFGAVDEPLAFFVVVQF